MNRTPMNRRMLRPLVFACLIAAVPCSLWAIQPSVTVQAPDLHGSRPLEKQTTAAVVRDYLQSWRSLQTAFEQNRASALSPDFVGTALTQLGATVRSQNALGIRTRYLDRSHNLQIVFYSPEGMSIQLVDDVSYDQQVVKGGTVLATRPVRAQYIVVLTPAQARWQVRIFQGTAPSAAQ